MTRFHRRPAAAALLALAFCLPLSACSDDDEEGDYVLVWSDEFDGPVDTPIEPSRWVHDVGGGGWGNNQLEFDTDRIENASLDGQGNLRIVARQESFDDRDYTSARIKTQDRFEQAYGRFEARIKLPRGQGIWPAFWMLGENFPVVGWPECGEIDIMEYRGQQPYRIHGSAHGPGYFGARPVTQAFDLPAGDFDDDFHVFSIEWTDKRITWFVDGEPYQRMRPEDLPPGGRWVFDQPFFLLLNVAVGGNFVGAPDATTQFPQTMLIDYVRVYARE